MVARNGGRRSRRHERTGREFLAGLIEDAVAMMQLPLVRLQQELGYSFSDPALLVRSLTHVSYERKKEDAHNEVLEFLGDAVLDLAISDLLIRRYPTRSEGDLSRMRAALVNS